MAAPEEDITRLLLTARDRATADAADRLFRAVEGELRALARSLTARRPGDPTVQTTLLVDEAFVRLVNDPTREWADRAAFYRVAYGTMRRVLADLGRRRRPEALQGRAGVPLGGAPPDPARAAENREAMAVLAETITALEADDPAAAAAFMLCFFHALPAAGEAATLLPGYADETMPLRDMAKLSGSSVSTVHRHLGRAIQYISARL